MEAREDLLHLPDDIYSEILSYLSLEERFCLWAPLCKKFHHLSLALPLLLLPFPHSAPEEISPIRDTEEEYYRREEAGEDGLAIPSLDDATRFLDEQPFFSKLVGEKVLGLSFASPITSVALEALLRKFPNIHTLSISTLIVSNDGADGMEEYAAGKLYEWKLLEHLEILSLFAVAPFRLSLPIVKTVNIRFGSELNYYPLRGSSPLYIPSSDFRGENLFASLNSRLESLRLNFPISDLLCGSLNDLRKVSLSPLSHRNKQFQEKEELAIFRNLESLESAKLEKLSLSFFSTLQPIPTLTSFSDTLTTLSLRYIRSITVESVRSLSNLTSLSLRCVGRQGLLPFFSLDHLSSNLRILEIENSDEKFSNFESMDYYALRKFSKGLREFSWGGEIEESSFPFFLMALASFENLQKFSYSQAGSYHGTSIVSIDQLLGSLPTTLRGLSLDMMLPTSAFSLIARFTTLEELVVEWDPVREGEINVKTRNKEEAEVRKMEDVMLEIWRTLLHPWKKSLRILQATQWKPYRSTNSIQLDLVSFANIFSSMERLQTVVLRGFFDSTPTEKKKRRVAEFRKVAPLISEVIIEDSFY